MVSVLARGPEAALARIAAWYESQGVPFWSQHVGDPILQSNRPRRVDFALFMVKALENDALIQEAPAIVGCQTPSALAHTAKIEAQDGG